MTAPVGSDGSVILVIIAEEPATGLDADIAEMVSIDIGVQAPEQWSRETAVNLPMMDSSGPFDYDVTGKLLQLCHELGLGAQRDVYRDHHLNARRHVPIVDGARVPSNNTSAAPAQHIDVIDSGVEPGRGIEPRTYSLRGSED